METGDLTGDFSFKTWKNRFLSQNLRFNLRFSKFMHFSKIHFILNLPLSWFLQKMISHQYNLILNPWCNHDVKPNIMEHRYSIVTSKTHTMFHLTNGETTRTRAGAGEGVAKKHSPDSFQRTTSPNLFMDYIWKFSIKVQ